MTGTKVIHPDRPAYSNRRLYDTQRRAYRKRTTAGTQGPLLDAIAVGCMLRMSRSAVQAMIADGDFPQATHRKGTRNAWPEHVVKAWLSLGESHG